MNIAEQIAQHEAKEAARAEVKAAQVASSDAWDAYMVASNAERAAEDAWDAEIKTGVVNDGPAEKVYFKAHKAANRALDAYTKASNKSTRLGIQAREKWGI